MVVRSARIELSYWTGSIEGSVVKPQVDQKI